MLEGLDPTEVHMLFDLLDSQRAGTARRIDTNSAADSLIEMLEEFEDRGLVELFELDEDPAILVVEVLPEAEQALDARRGEGGTAEAVPVAAEVAVAVEAEEPDKDDSLHLETLAPFSSDEIDAVPRKFYIRAGNRVQGPYNAEKVLSYAVQGRLKDAHELSEDQETWISALEHDLTSALVKAVKATGGAAPAVPATPATPAAQAAPAVAKKSKRRPRTRKRRKNETLATPAASLAVGALLAEEAAAPAAAPAPAAPAARPAAASGGVMTPRDVGVTCEGCLYFTRGEGPVGICARMPPRPVFPIVQANAWCGEWRSVDDPDLGLTDVLGA